MSKLAKINRRNPLAKDLAVYVYPLNERQICEAVGGKVLDRTASGTTTAPTIAPMEMPKYGRGVSFTGNEFTGSAGPHTLDWKSHVPFNPDEGTIALIAEVYNVGTGSYVSLTLGSSLTDGERIEVSLSQWEGIANFVAAWVNLNSTTDDIVSVANGDVIAFIASWKNGAGDTSVVNKFTYKIKDGSIATSEDTGLPTIDASRWNGGSFPLDYIQFGISNRARTSVAAYWNRRLSYDEMRRWADNPWQVLLEEKPIIGAHELPTDVKFAPIKRPWTKQPPAGTQIDLGGSLGRGLSFVAPMNTASCHCWAKDYGWKAATISGTGITHTTSTPGKVFKFDGSVVGEDQIDTNTRISLSGKRGFTFSGFVNSEFEGVNEDVVFSNYAGGDDAVVLVRIEPSNGNVEFYIRSTSGIINVFAGALSANTWHFIVCRFDADNDGLSVWVDGVKSSTTTAHTNSFTTTADANRNILIGNWDPSSNDEMDGMLGTQAAWDRALTDGEVRALSSNPWQIFEPEIIHAPFNEELPELVKFEVQS